MTEEITLKRETVEQLVYGAGHLYYPAFPDNEQRHNIGIAVSEAVEQLEAA